MNAFAFVAGCAVGAAGVALLVFLVLILGPWRRLVTSGGMSSPVRVLGMRLRGNSPSLIIDAYLSLLHSGALVTLGDVESHYIAKRTRIVTSGDLVESIRKDAVNRSVALWLDCDELQWLAAYCTARAEVVSEEPGRESVSTEEVLHFNRLRTRANAALQKLRLIQERREYSS